MKPSLTKPEILIMMMFSNNTELKLYKLSISLIPAKASTNKFFHPFLTEMIANYYCSKKKFEIFAG